MTHLDERIQQEIAVATPDVGPPLAAVHWTPDGGWLVRIEGEPALATRDCETALEYLGRYARSITTRVGDLGDDDITEAAAFAAWQDAMEEEVDE